LRTDTRLAYAERINRAVEHVMRHLAEPLRLADVAGAAHLSPFHFHRVFQACTGETLADFVRRVRLARALARMSERPRPALTQIALDCGFASSSDFSRAFRQRYGSPPSRFDLAAWRATHRDALEATVGQPAAPPPQSFEVVLRDLPARDVAYIAVPDPYRGDAVLRATERLADWAEREGHAGGDWLGFQWDDPELTDLEQCRYHVGVVAGRFQPRGEIGRLHFAPMRVAEIELHGDIELELRALQWLYGHWLPASGCVPDDHPAFEAWIGHPLAQSPERLALRVQLPVRSVRPVGTVRPAQPASKAETRAPATRRAMRRRARIRR
jgi:AraC family transcriptional regulator